MELKYLLGIIFFILLGVTLGQAQSPKTTELHWSVCEPSSAKILEKLGLDLKKRNQRQVSYFDHWSYENNDFENYSRGVILRRRITDDKITSTVKIKFNTSQVISENSDEAKCESDLSPERLNHYCSVDNKLMSSEENIHENYSSFQLNFLAEQDRAIAWSKLKEFGPVINTVWKLRRDGQTDLVLEELELPAQRVFELSTRHEGEDAKSEFKRVSAWLKDREIQLCSEQQSKVRQVLEAYQ